jgi:hypothetical protein
MGNVINPIGEESGQDAIERAKAWGKLQDAETQTSGVQSGKGQKKVGGEGKTSGQVFLDGSGKADAVQPKVQGRGPESPDLPLSSLVKNSDINFAARFMASPEMVALYLVLVEITGAKADQNLVMAQYENKVSAAIAENAKVSAEMILKAGREQANSLLEAAKASGAAATTALTGAVTAGLSMAATIAGEVRAYYKGKGMEEDITKGKGPQPAKVPEVQVQLAKGPSDAATPKFTPLEQKQIIEARQEARVPFVAFEKAGQMASSAAQASSQMTQAETQRAQAAQKKEETGATAAKEIATQQAEAFKKLYESLKKVDVNSEESVKELRHTFESVLKAQGGNIGATAS